MKKIKTYTLHILLWSGIFGVFNTKIKAQIQLQNLPTESMHIGEAESQFLKNNLYILAAHFNIDASKAQTIQAKIWDLPFISGEVNAINPKAGRVLDVGGAGQKAFAIQQLIYLGSKKKNQIAVSQSNEAIAELSFQELLRNLKFQLRQSFYSIYFNEKKIETLDLQIEHISELVGSVDVQVSKGNIPLKELVRLQSLLITFRNERNELVKNNLELQSDLKILLNNAHDVSPILDGNELENFQKTTIESSDELFARALENRPDYLQALKNIEANQWNLKWQNSLAKPDLTLGASYDQRGGAFNNQINITAGIPLALWNRNKGNIKLANVGLIQAQADKNTILQRIKMEVFTSVAKWQTSKTNLTQLPQKTIADFKTVYEGVLQNYKKRNIEIIEFTDFMESFNTMSLQLFELQKNIVLSAEELNTVTNSEIF